MLPQEVKMSKDMVVHRKITIQLAKGSRSSFPLVSWIWIYFLPILVTVTPHFLLFSCPKPKVRAGSTDILTLDHLFSERHQANQITLFQKYILRPNSCMDMLLCLWLYMTCLTLKNCCLRIFLIKFDKLFWNLGPCILLIAWIFSLFDVLLCINHIWLFGHRHLSQFMILVHNFFYRDKCLCSWGPDLVNKLILCYTILLL